MSSPPGVTETDHASRRRGWLGALRDWITAEDVAPQAGTRGPATSAAAPPTAAVGVFGKHPAWDDFMPDLIVPPPCAGETPPLRTLRRTLIDSAVAAHVEANTFDDWPRVDQLGGFEHVLLYRPAGGTGAVVCGRIDDSEDGRGRRRYPLVLAAQVSAAAAPAGLPPARAQTLCVDWCCARGLPGLANLHGRLAPAETKAEVTAEATEAAAALARGLPAQLAELAPDQLPDGEAALRELDELLGESKPNRRAAMAVLYELENRLRGYAISSSAPVPQRGDHLRLPTAALVTAEAMRLWAHFLFGELRRDVDVLLVAPADPVRLSPACDDDGWVDLLIGPAAPATTLCLFASTSRVVPATRIPFRYDESFLIRAGRRLGRRAAPPPRF